MKTDNEKYNEQVKPNTAFLKELKNKLPEFFTKDGSFDIDKFREQLKEKNVNELSEGYQLNFIGKDYARRQAGEMPSTVIVPDEEQNNGEGKDSMNLFFTGDNLEVLRHLQNAYANKIDVIYIDPPYNTGNGDFVYPDSFEYSDDKLKEMFGFDDGQVERLKSIQGKSSHSAWLTFMYPRLVLAKKLLSDKGIIFISIDDNECDNLAEICNEIFGENNFIANLVWANKEGGGSSDSKHFRIKHEYCLVFSSNKNLIEINGLDVEDSDRYKFFDKHVKDRGRYQLVKLDSASIQYSDSLNYPIDAPDGSKIFPGDGTKQACWRWSKQKLDWGLKNDYIVIKKNRDNNWSVYTKQYLNADNNGKIIKRTRQPLGIIEKYSTTQSNKELKKYFNGTQIFNYSKPIGYIKYLLSLLSANCMVLDFFAGSSTTADAVMQLNAEDGGHRKFIMVQLPEKTYHLNKDGQEIPTKGGKTAYDAGYRSIDEISRERIRRAANKIREDNKLTLPEDFDGSFKHYRVVKPAQQTLDEIEDFNPDETALFTNMVDGFSSQSLEVDGNASGEATIMTTWLAKDGYQFDADIKQVDFAGYQGSVVDNNQLYLIKEGWGTKNTQELLNQLGTHKLDVQAVVIFGYSFNIAELRELENGLKQLENKVELQKRY